MAGVLIPAVLVAGCSVDTLPAATVTASTPAATSTPRSTEGPVVPTATAAGTPPAVAGIVNFRDVAGPGLALSGGGTMARGVVYRSAALHGASAADLKALEGAGVGLVLDLRSRRVASLAPDPAVPGARTEIVDVFAGTHESAASVRTVAQARAHMQAMNVAFVAEPAQRARLAEVLRLVAEAERPVLVHCTHGKDRTGWVSALLQLVAGADRSQVMAEYLASNSYRSAENERAYERARAREGRRAARVERALLEVRPGYLQAGLDELDRRYGDLHGYLTAGLGLSEATINELRTRLAG
ncbi:tyrosine-protein phosphatase [Propionicimonas sp.]|uniref:tyrosine-protein phosphatase n=1 Tax=Propionicimonas sp. TaxID=1955623 RepID=UPI0039E43643